MIKKVKEAVNIPVIGNGDVVDGITAKEMFEKTGVDGIMIGRGALGNPWIFKDIIHYLETGEELPKRTNKEKLDTIIKHFTLLLEEKGEYTAVREIRKHAAWYVKNMKDASKFKCEVNKIEKADDFIQAVKEFFD